MNRVISGLLLALFLTALPAFAGQAPDLKGTWVSQTATLAKIKDGISVNSKAASTLVIEDQRDRVFTGYKKWTVKGETFTERFAGGIGVDNEVYIAEEKDGELHGDYDAAAGALLLFYVESGPDAKVIQGVYVKTP